MCYCVHLTAWGLTWFHINWYSKELIFLILLEINKQILLCFYRKRELLHHLMTGIHPSHQLRLCRMWMVKEIGELLNNHLPSPFTSTYFTFTSISTSIYLHLHLVFLGSRYPWNEKFYLINSECPHDVGLKIILDALPCHKLWFLVVFDHPAWFGYDFRSCLVSDILWWP